jgi:NAD(P)-dependent dehydrogenase (short-subunit alcohol dehydrogenase family)
LEFRRPAGQDADEHLERTTLMSSADHTPVDRQAPVVVVTGASAGIGRAAAIAFAQRGWRVALLARGRAGLQAAQEDVEAAGGSGLVIPVDVAEAAAVDAAAAQVMQHWSRIDVWVNNAMLTVFGPAERVPPDEWARVTQVTYLGAVHGTLAALATMKPRGRGTIVQVGSALAYRSIPLQAPYCAAKAALRGFTDSLRSELLHDRSGVRLTMVHLPGVNTPQFSWSRTHMQARHRPVGPIYRPEAAAEAIVQAALRAPRELWVGAPVLEAVLGTMLGPGLLDRLLARTAYQPQLAPGGADTTFDILDAPADADHGVDGPFPEHARPHATLMRPVAVRAAIALLMLGSFAAALAGKRVLPRIRP